MLPVLFISYPENRICLSLPTKDGFFQKVPTEQRKGLGAFFLSFLGF